jgi:hypothetical protein
MKFLVIFLIKIYQKTLGVIKGNTCIFYPTCSEYSKEAIKKYGIIKGFVMSIKRISKCHPWNECKVDNIE